MKITEVNGFDKNNSDNARQNNYAWSIGELGDYIYVGTGRNLVYIMFKALGISEVNPPKEFTPENLDMSAEIWRYKKDGSLPWERVYKAPENSGIIGFRFMINHSRDGKAFLYAGCYNMSPKILLLKTTDGVSWKTIDTGISAGTSTRAIVEHNNKLYMAVMNDRVKDKNTHVYCSLDPEVHGWKEITFTGGNKNPRGQAVSLCSFNNHLYVACENPKGFEVWRSEDLEPSKDQWKLVVDKGAGDEANAQPYTMEKFKDYLYVGTVKTPENMLMGEKFSIKPFDLIRIDVKDNWEVVIGGKADVPSSPETGKRKPPLSLNASGFGKKTNGYCWQLKEYRNELYLGTWDWSVSLEPFYKWMLENKKAILKYTSNDGVKFLLNNSTIVKLYLFTLKKDYGFDLWKSGDGLTWKCLSSNGLGNKENYGVRNIFVSSDMNMYIGTANLFEGCEIWRKED